MNDPSTALAQLRAAHPLWAFGTTWATVNTGPDARRLTATREGVLLSAWTAGELAAKIAAEEAANGWPRA